MTPHSFGGASSDAHGITRRGALCAGARLAVVVGLGSSARTLWQPASAAAIEGDPASVARYLELMDHVSVVIFPRWSDEQRMYARIGVSGTLVNARMLFVHAIAASLGHNGPSRQDARAAALARRLCEAPAPYRLQGNPITMRDKMFHVPGWTSSMTEPNADMDKSIDPQVAEALAAAYQVGATIGLGAADLQQIVRRVSECARGVFFRYPNMRLNQINWNSQLYALDHRLTGDPVLLHVDYRKQVLRFARHSTRPAKRGGSPNLGPGYHFVYLPRAPPRSAINIDSAEYANETIDFLRHYRGARTAGMQPLPADARRVLRAYLRRTLYGHWAHSGYLNWDTGLDERRRYIGKTWAFAQQGLLAMIMADEFRTADMAAHARLLFDRGLALYLGWARADPTGLAPQVQFGSRDHPQGDGHRWVFAARMASNAAQALALGIASTPSHLPSAMYSFDPDTQRLAISTEHYSTAILVHNHRATEYGGLDPNRLFDALQRPVGSIGGAGNANFSARVRAASGRVLVSSQHSDPWRASMHVEVRTGDGVSRVGPRSAAYPRVPYAGPMRSVRTRGRIAARSAQIITRHAFAASHIDLRWELRVPRGGRWEVRLPTFGSHTTVTVERASGPRQRLGSARTMWARVRRLVVEGAHGGYSLTRLRTPAGTRVRALRPVRAKGVPNPGPTITLDGRVGPARIVRIAVRIRVHG